MSHLRVRAELQLAAEEGDKNSVNRQSPEVSHSCLPPLRSKMNLVRLPVV
jgi:hypothetical protein